MTGSNLNPAPARARALALAHAAWVISLILGLIVILASLTGYAVWLRGESPITPGPDPVSPFYVLSGVTSLATVLICLALALLLFQRRRNDPMALFVSFYVMAYGVIFAGPLEFLNPLFPGIAELASGIIHPLFMTVPTVALLVLFPNGRAVPAWSRWLIPLGAGILAFLPFVDARSASAFNTMPAQLMGLFLLTVLGLAFGAHVYRYRRVSTAVEREQTRWVVFGLILWIVLGTVQGIPYLYLQNLPPGAPPPAWAAAGASVWFLSLSCIPATLTIAILRYRLYEIEIILNRALVYGALTAILAGVYSASMSLLQRLFVAVTGEKSDAAIVLTTLILASALTPLRTRLQAVVDRRLRDVHDPLRRLADFSGHVDSGVWVVDTRLALSRLLLEAVAAFDAVSGAAYAQSDAGEAAIATYGEWQEEARLTAHLTVQGRQIGRIALGPRQNAAAYTKGDEESLARALGAIARALS